MEIDEFSNLLSTSFGKISSVGRKYIIDGKEYHSFDEVIQLLIDSLPPNKEEEINFLKTLINKKKQDRLKRKFTKVLTELSGYSHKRTTTYKIKNKTVSFKGKGGVEFENKTIYPDGKIVINSMKGDEIEYSEVEQEETEKEEWFDPEEYYNNFSDPLIKHFAPALIERSNNSEEVFKNLDDDSDREWIISSEFEKIKKLGKLNDLLCLAKDLYKKYFENSDIDCSNEKNFNKILKKNERIEKIRENLENIIDSNLDIQDKCKEIREILRKFYNKDLKSLTLQIRKKKIFEFLLINQTLNNLFYQEVNTIIGCFNSGILFHLKKDLQKSIPDYLK